MPANSDNRARWEDDIAQSVYQYNKWFLEFAPQAYRKTKSETVDQVRRAFEGTRNLRSVTPASLREHPKILQTLRMIMAPPLAQDRLAGLAGVSDNLIDAMEKDNRVPPQMQESDVSQQLQKICDVVARLIDFDVFPWTRDNRDPESDETTRAESIIADRLCSAIADPIIRNEQERRQLTVIGEWLNQRGYSMSERLDFERMRASTYAFHLNIWGQQENGTQVKVPVDVVIAPSKSRPSNLPLLVETKSAGDFTNPNKRRKEESDKIANLRRRYGGNLPYTLFLCGYFNVNYLQYEADNRIDWIWQHRIDDFAKLGV